MRARRAQIRRPKDVGTALVPSHASAPSLVNMRGPKNAHVTNNDIFQQHAHVQFLLLVFRSMSLRKLVHNADIHFSDFSSPVS